MRTGFVSFLVLICFLLISNRALAAGHRLAQSGYVDLPAGCLQKKDYPCSLKSGQGVFQVELDGVLIRLGSDTSVQFVQEKKVHLLGGLVWIQGAHQWQLMMKQDSWMAFDGEIFATRKLINGRGDLRIHNLNAEVQFHSPYVFAAEVLPVGFQNWYGSVDAAKSLQRGIIQPIDLKEFLSQWYPVSQVTAAGLKKRIVKMKEKNRENVELSSKFYKDVIERRIASQRDLDLRREAKARAARLESERIRQLYRRKAGLEAP